MSENPHLVFLIDLLNPILKVKRHFGSATIHRYPKIRTSFLFGAVIVDDGPTFGLLTNTFVFMPHHW